MQLELKPYTQCRVLIVDDEAMSRTILSSILTPFFSCDSAESGKEAIEFCKQIQPDLVLLDMNMPDMNGLEVCGHIKSMPGGQHIPIIFVTSTIDVETQNTCWEAGASDFIVKPVTSSTLVHRIKNHLQNKLRMELLAKMTFHDQLTGLYNRLYLTNEVPLMIKQVARDQQKVGLIMVDIDYFKLFNDRYGHLEGDICLQKVASAIDSHVKRPKDAAIRFGGEEFILLLPYTDLAGTKTVADNLIKAVYDLNLAHDSSSKGRVTLSAGYCSQSASHVLEEGISDLIEKADIALFEAKEFGRNRAVGR